MKKSLKTILFTALILLGSSSLRAQYLSDSSKEFNAGTPMTGRIWGYAFGDYFYKSNADALNRGSNNQYSGYMKDRNAFQFRRIYLGYDYNFSKKFSSELLLAAEDNFDGKGNPITSGASGDLVNGKLGFYIKLANLRIKNIWEGTDLVIGQQGTPAFSGSSEKVWGYRSIEKTIADFHKTPSFDMGVGLQGTFDPKTKNYGYNLLVGNGAQSLNGAKPSQNNNKYLYGDIWAKFLDQKLIVDVYADYARTNDWAVKTGTDQTSRQMLKGFVSYSTSPISVGLEGFVNNLKNGINATKIDGSGADVLNDVATGISAFVTGDIVKNQLRFFARYDAFTPTTKVDNNKYSNYTLLTPSYNEGSTAPTKISDQTYKQNFITLGLDWMPAKNIHIMPNIWYNHYSTQLTGDNNTAVNGDLADKAKGDHDLVYRLTFYYTFGK